MPRYIVHRHVNVTYRWIVDAPDEGIAREMSEELYVLDDDHAEWDRETIETYVQLLDNPTE